MLRVCTGRGPTRLLQGAHVRIAETTTLFYAKGTQKKTIYKHDKPNQPAKTSRRSSWTQKLTHRRTWAQLNCGRHSSHGARRQVIENTNRVLFQSRKREACAHATQHSAKTVRTIPDTFLRHLIPASQVLTLTCCEVPCATNCRAIPNPSPGEGLSEQKAFHPTPWHQTCSPQQRPLVCQQDMSHALRGRCI